jgi:hypothetical protein
MVFLYIPYWTSRWVSIGFCNEILNFSDMGTCLLNIARIFGLGLGSCTRVELGQNLRINPKQEWMKEHPNKDETIFKNYTYWMTNYNTWNC